MNILLATDGSEYSRKAIEKSCELLQTGKIKEIKIISVVEQLTPMATEPFGMSEDYYVKIQEDLRKQSKEAVARAEKIIAEKLADLDVLIRSEIISGNAKDTILDEAKKIEADLIVVGTHGYGFIDRILIGSVSNFLVNHSPCSVLVVRPD